MPERSKLAQSPLATKLAVMNLTDQANALAHSVGARELSDSALIRVQGPDARSWLNGQISNNVAMPKAGQALYAVAPSAKGKILSDLWVFDRGSELWLLMPSHVRSDLMQQFEKYIIMEKVSLQPVDDYVVWTLQGPAAAPLVGQLSVQDMQVFDCDRLGHCGVDLMFPVAQQESLRRALIPLLEAAHGVIVSDEAWELARLRQGIPRFGIDFDSQHYPQEAGIAQRAVSFTKGCYIGQEVVAMLEHRGKLKRQLAKVQTPEPAVFAAGDTLYSNDKTKVGTISSAVLDAERACMTGLTMLATTFLESHREAFTHEGAIVTLEPLR